MTTCNPKYKQNKIQIHTLPMEPRNCPFNTEKVSSQHKSHSSPAHLHLENTQVKRCFAEFWFNLFCKIQTA